MIRLLSEKDRVTEGKYYRGFCLTKGILRENPVKKLVEKEISIRKYMTGMMVPLLQYPYIGLYDKNHRFVCRKSVKKQL